jgi:hypothetical protein
MVTDGQRLYFQGSEGNRIVLAEVSVSGGDSAVIPTPFQNTVLGDIAPDGSSLLIGSFEATEKRSPMWLLPLPAGPPRALGITTYFGVWTPDGHHLLFPDGPDLYQANPDGSNPKKLVTLSASISDIMVSPDGRKIRVTLGDIGTSSSELWELNRDGSQPHPLLPNWDDSPHEWGARWTPDGRYFLFTSFRQGRTSLWALPEHPQWFQSKAKPVQLTNGPLDFWLPPWADCRGPRCFATTGSPSFRI